MSGKDAANRSERPGDLPLASYLDVRGLSARTGLSPSTIHRLKDQGKIPFYQPAGKRGRLLFPVDAIERAATVSNEPSSLSPEGRPHLSGPPPAWMRPAP
jgi:hypothetical protein